MVLDHPSLPSASGAFNLFPNRKQPANFPSTSLPPSHTIQSDLAELRSFAFWDLRRSVAESSEGFIQRMRDWEHSRSRSDPHCLRLRHPGSQRPGRKHPRTGRAPRRIVQGGDVSDDCQDAHVFTTAPHSASPTHDLDIQPSPSKKRALSLDLIDNNSADDSDDDVLIFSSSPDPIASTTKKRSVSLDWTGTDAGPLLTGFASGHGAPAPNMDIGSLPSAYSSDDDDDQCETLSLSSSDLAPSRCQSHHFRFHPSAISPFMPSTAYTPSLSHTYSASTNSSLVSLPLLPPPLFSGPNHVPALPFTFGLREPSLPSSRNEKAIAALTLAMANGAAGLSDYEALRAAQGAAALQDPEAGELWS